MVARLVVLGRLRLFGSAGARRRAATNLSESPLPLTFAPLPLAAALAPPALLVRKALHRRLELRPRGRPWMSGPRRFRRSAARVGLTSRSNAARACRVSARAALDVAATAVKSTCMRCARSSSAPTPQPKKHSITQLATKSACCSFVLGVPLSGLGRYAPPVHVRLDAVRTPHVSQHVQQRFQDFRPRFCNDPAPSPALWPPCAAPAADRPSRYFDTDSAFQIDVLLHMRCAVRLSASSIVGDPAGSTHGMLSPTPS